MALSTEASNLASKFDEHYNKLSLVIDAAGQNNALLITFSDKLQVMWTALQATLRDNLLQNSNLGTEQEQSNTLSAVTERAKGVAAATRSRSFVSSPKLSGSRSSSPVINSPIGSGSKYKGLSRRERKERVAEERRIRRELAFADKKAKEKHIALIKQKKSREQARKLAAEKQRRQMQISLAKAEAEGRGIEFSGVL